MGILSDKDKRRTLKVHVDEFDKDFYLGALTGSEFIQFQSLVSEVHGTDDEMSLMDEIIQTLIMVICDENGKRIFSIDQKEEFLEEDAQGLLRLFSEAVKFLNPDKVLETEGKKSKPDLQSISRTA